MSAVTKLMDGIGNALDGVFEFLEPAFEKIGSVVEQVITPMANMFANAMEHPLETVIQVVGACYGVPVYITAPAITAAQGGSLEDIAKSAAAAYASSEFMSNTQMGADIKNFTSNAVAGDFTDSMMENFNLTPDQAVQVAKVSTAALNSAVMGGITSAISGKSVLSGMESGFTSGLVYSSTDSFFNSINKDQNWGLSQTSLNLIKGASTTALNNVINGRGDPAAAIGNYIAGAIVSMGTSGGLQKAAKELYDDFTIKTATAQASQTKYLDLQNKVQEKAAESETLRTDINNAMKEMTDIKTSEYDPLNAKLQEALATHAEGKTEYDAAKKTYTDNLNINDNYGFEMQKLGFEPRQFDGDGFGGTVYEKVTQDADGNPVTTSAPDISTYYNAAMAGKTAANAAAKKSNDAGELAKGFAEAMAPIEAKITPLQAIVASKTKDFNAIKDDIGTPSGNNLASQLQTAANTYQTDYSTYAASQTAATRAAENSAKQVAAVATRNATIDALNSGVITASKNANGSYALSNGMMLDSTGKFFQDGTPAFGDAAGIAQSKMQFGDGTGNLVDFNTNAGRVMSPTDVQSTLSKWFNVSATPEEAQALVNKGIDPNDFQSTLGKFTDDKVISTYKGVTGTDPTPAQVETIRKSGTEIMTAAQQAAVNGLDLPEGYVSPGDDLATKVSRGQAYAAARLAYGPNATFDWTDPKTGVSSKYTTENAQEQSLRIDKAAAAAGKYDSDVIAYTKYKLTSDLSNPILNPADLTPVSMLAFVEAYRNASPSQRTALLQGTDKATFQSIDNVLNDTIKWNPKGAILNPAQPNAVYNDPFSNPMGDPMAEYAGSVKSDSHALTEVFDTIKNGGKISNAAFTVLTGDILGLAARGTQFLANDLGIDTASIDKVQDMLSNMKTTSLSKLAGNDAVIAGGIASGIESLGSFALLGPAGALAALGAIAANASWIEGAKTWIDTTNNKTYDSKEEAIKAAGTNIRQLTTMENAERTAIMTALEILGESVGIPGMKVLMKGIPFGGGSKEIINYVKTAGLALGNEVWSEEMTTAAQMAADKWEGYGLGKNATAADLVNAMKDTALATIFAVGTSHSGASVSANLRAAANYSNPFSTNTGLDQVTPDVPSLAAAAKALGISDADFKTMQQNIQDSIKNGTVSSTTKADEISKLLQDAGMSTVKADAIADGMTSKIAEITVDDFLKSSGLDPTQVAALSPLVLSQITSGADLNTIGTNVASLLTGAGLNPAAATSFTNTLFNNSSNVSTLNQDVVKTATDTIATVKTGTNTAVVTGANDVKPVQTHVDDTGRTNTAGTTVTGTTNTTGGASTGTTGGTTTGTAATSTTGGTNTGTTVGTGTTTGTTTGTAATGTTAGTGTTATDTTQTAVAGLTAEQVTKIVTDAIAANPSLTTAQVSTLISTALTQNPNVTIADVKGLISAIPAGLTTAQVQTIVDASIADSTKELKTAITDATAGFATTAALTKAQDDLTKAITDLSTKTTTDTTALTTAIADLKAAGLTEDQVKALITAGTADVSDATKTAINDAVAGLATSADLTTAKTALEKAISDLSTKTTTDTTALTTAIADLKAAGLTEAQVKALVDAGTANVSDATKTAINDAVSGLATSADLVTAKADLAKAISDLSTKTTTDTTALTTAIADLKAAGLTEDQVKALIATGTADVSAATKTAINDAVAGLATSADLTTAKESLAKAISDLSTQTTTDTTALATAIADLKAAGLTEDQVKALIATGTANVSDATKTAINNAVSGLATSADLTTAQTALTKAISDLSTQTTTDTTALTKAIADLKAAGLTEDQVKALIATGTANVSDATKTAINDATKDLATTSALDAAKTGLTKAISDLSTQTTTDMTAVNKAIADLKAAGLTEAQVKALVDTGTAGVTTELKTAITDAVSGIKTALETAEANLTKSIADLASGTTTNFSTLTKSIADLKAAGLTEAQVKALVDTASAGVTTELKTAISDAATAASTELAKTQTALETKIADLGTDVKTKYDSLTQAQKDEVAARVQQGVDITAAITDATSTLATQITGLSTDLQAKYDAMTAAQKAEVAARTASGIKIEDAITATQTQITGLSTDLQTKYDALTAAQKTEVDARVKQGIDVTKAITDAASGLQTQITGLSADLQTKYDALTAAQKATIDLQVAQGIKLEDAIRTTAATTQTKISDLKTDVQTKYDALTAAQKTEVDARVAQGIKIEDAIKTTSEATQTQITNTQTQFNTRVDQLVTQGQTQQAATDTALKELNAGVLAIQTEQQAAKDTAAAAATEAKRVTAQSGTNIALAGAMGLVGGAVGAVGMPQSVKTTPIVDDTIPGYKKIGFTSTGDAAKYVSPLEQYLKQVMGDSYANPQQQAAPVNQQGSSAWSYGQDTSIDNNLGGVDSQLASSTLPEMGNYQSSMYSSKKGGLVPPLMAAGGSTRYGKYAGGGLNTVNFEGKNRIDFRTGNAVTGPGDGQSDDIPAMLADGEFVFPADVVAALGNGSTKAGSDKLYDMMHSIRSHSRSTDPKKLPPPAKSPLDYLNKRARR